MAIYVYRRESWEEPSAMPKDRHDTINVTLLHVKGEMYTNTPKCKCEFYQVLSVLCSIGDLL